MNRDQRLDYLIVGHVSLDVSEQGETPGGTAAYAGRTAAALGLQVGIVTSAGRPAAWRSIERLPHQVTPAEHSTRFENMYVEAGRKQRLLSRAADLDLESVPLAWRNPRVVHLAPIADEVDPGLARELPGALIALTPQGWLRRWDASGLIRRKEWSEVEAILPKAELVFVSQEDFINDPMWVELLAGRYPLLIITRGAAGATLYQRGVATDLPATPVVEIDATGAGDIFAACFVARFLERRDPLEAARFANRLAAAGVQRHGLEAVPNQHEITAAREQLPA
jgi:sugar/nucleoside kinase (ribokinase family)